MRFESQFDVDAPLERVWETMLDVERVAPTVPGATVLERTGADAYKVSIKVKVGPMSMTYRGEVEITERDEEAHRAVMKARAKESRGQGTADADVTMVLSGGDGRTSATVTTDVQLSGKVATMGQGVMQDVSGRLVQTFAQNLAAMLERGDAPTSEPPVPEPAAAPTGHAASERDDAQAAAPTVDGAPEREAVAATVESAAAREEARAAGAASADAASTRQERPAESADALDLGSLGGAVLAERLRDPRVFVGLLAAAAMAGYLIGRKQR